MTRWRAVDAFVDAMLDLGRAEIGDKTIIDAALPFREALREGIADGVGAAVGLRCGAAEAAARATAGLTPRKGRARPLAEKSVGTSDPGATSFALIVSALARFTN